MKKFFENILAFACFAVLMVSIAVCQAQSVSADGIYSKVLRLHVIAQSDNSRDQQLKLLVRDKLLEKTGHMFEDCDNIEDAVKIAKNNTHTLEETARQVIVENGYDYDVKILIGKEAYPEKTYGEYTFPKGEYCSLRVVIGEGQGQNWWCVLFPPLCNAGIEDTDKMLIKNGVNKDTVNGLKSQNKSGFAVGNTRVTFKFLEYFK